MLRRNLLTHSTNKSISRGKEMKMNNVMYHAGWDAFHKGLDVCPFDHPDDQFSWQWGWDAAAERSLEELQLILEQAK
jgi:ribosome modulation factor